MKKNNAYVTINGQKRNEISVFDHGLLYGDGIYETMRVFQGKAFLFNEHINRLYSSAKGIYLKVPYSKPELIQLIKTTYRKSKFSDAFIRILITRGEGDQGLISKSKPTVIIIVNQREFKPLKKVTLTVSRVRRINKTALNCKIKSLNYLNNILARFDAKKKRFDDSILLNDNDEVTEATTSNIFIVKNGKFFTPGLESGILEGATRKAIIKNFKVTEKTLLVKDILSADEVFLSGTVNFVSPVVNIDGKKFHNFAWTKKVCKQLEELSKHGVSL